ncbi:hypothetical protein [Thiomicrorhabdus xiamenensis]|uniref:Uncharacterized protein n=1 Tax=Thiomicrorhabdus xiamenensis TaxID=2739063 RepID=A0A7D4NZT8_9GAMM|nr:hypothetical protein [Thiomicrorhabdus xiamenensis]QKI89918.1 hypothetical protein HQN79_10195 [Thiomicrorhabdus xiamenensis]
MNDDIKAKLRQALQTEFNGYQIKRMPPIVFDDHWRKFTAVRNGQSERFIYLMDTRKSVCVIQKAKGGKVYKFAYSVQSDSQQEALL